MLSILGTLAIQISTNKRRRLGFVDELVNRNSHCIAHSVAGIAKYVTADKYVKFVTQSFTKMSRKSNSSLAAIFASYPHCDPCNISSCGNEVFGGSTNTKFNEFLCKYSCRLSFKCLQVRSIPIQRPGRKSWRYVQMRTSSTTAGAVNPGDTGHTNLHKTSVVASALSMNCYHRQPS